MNPTTFYKWACASLILLTVLACNALVPTPALTPSPLPPTATPTPVDQPLVISSFNLNKTSDNPAYTVNAQVPVILENSDPGALVFNDEMSFLVQSEIDAFKRSVSELPVDPTFAASSLDVQYNILFQGDELASIKFVFVGYASGAAHPYHYTITVNYDFEQGRQLSLSELFLPGAGFLEAIAKHCIAQLNTRDIGFDMFSEGAAPTPENYRNWNITREGLMITFDEYQVAPYAAGPQTVIVPYSELQSIIRPDGPLAGVTP